MKFILLAAVLVLFVKCSRKFGFRDTLTWASLIVVSIFPLSLAGGLAMPFFHWLWPLLSMKARLVTGMAVGVGGYAAIKEKGLGEVLRWSFALAILACFVVFGFDLVILFFIAASNGGH